MIYDADGFATMPVDVPNADGLQFFALARAADFQ
jgi:hypothetical protein